MKTSVWHSIEQRTIDASIDQWHARLEGCRVQTCRRRTFWTQYCKKNIDKRSLPCGHLL